MPTHGSIQHILIYTAVLELSRYVSALMTLANKMFQGNLIAKNYSDFQSFRWFRCYQF